MHTRVLPRNKQEKWNAININHIKHGKNEEAHTPKSLFDFLCRGAWIIQKNEKVFFFGSL